MWSLAVHCQTRLPWGLTSWITQSAMVEFGPGAGFPGRPVRSTPLLNGYDSSRWSPLGNVSSSWESVGLPTVAMLCVCPVSRLYTLYAPFGSVENPPLEGMNATVSLPSGVTLAGVPCATRLYQTGVP